MEETTPKGPAQQEPKEPTEYFIVLFKRSDRKNWRVETHGNLKSFAKGWATHKNVEDREKKIYRVDCVTGEIAPYEE